MRPLTRAGGQPPRASGSFHDDLLDFLMHNHARCGPVFVARLDRVGPTVVVGTRDGVRELFARERGALEVFNTPLVHDLFGRCVFNLTGSEHVRSRRLLRASLGRRALRPYLDPLRQVAEAHITRWSRQPAFDLYQAARDITLAMSASAILGFAEADPEMNLLGDAFSTFVAATGGPSGYLRRWSPGYWAGRRARADLNALFVCQIIRSVDTPRTDVLANLAASWTDADPALGQLGDHMLALLIAARETTASLITWCLAELAQHADLAAEVATEAGRASDNPALFLDRDALPQTRAVLAETQRLHSPNMISVRRAMYPVELGGFTLPAGVLVAYSPSANHFDPLTFTRPFAFRPDRFVAGDASTTDLLTFGGGAHTCLGRHLAELMTLVVLVSVHARWDLTLLDGLPAQVRRLPVKAPVGPLPARLHTVRRRAA